MTDDVLLDALFRIKDNVAALDNSFVITYVNQAFADNVGLKIPEMLGKNIITLLPQAMPVMRNEIIQAISKKETRRFEWKGAYSGLFLETTIFPSDKGVTIISRDITKRKKIEQSLRESQELFSIAFHSSPAALAITCLKDSRIRDANQTFLDLLEYTRAEVIGHTTKELGIFPDYSKREELGARLLEKGSVRNQEIRVKTKTGELLQCLISLELVIFQEEKHFLASVIDITQMKSLQTELQNYSSNLEKIVQERTKQLKDSERLAAIGQTAGMVGHDIRNPLQAIMGDVYLLKEYLTSMPKMPMKNDVSDSLNEIEKNIGYINKIVADLQDYARPLKPEYANVDISEVMTNVVKNVYVPDDIKVNVVSNTFKKVKTDPTFVRRILTNLVNNSIQAMPDGGNLELTSLLKGDNVYLTVSDTGVGIPEDLKSKLFSPMVTTKAKGQGLGLAVAKRLVDALNGTINFESQEGNGTKFIIELPL